MMSEGEPTTAAWYVTNGERVVGPIETGALVHAVAIGCVAESCRVWNEDAPGWRALDTIREIRALGRARATRGDDWVPSETWKPGGGPQAATLRASVWMDDAADESEVVTLALQAMMLETRATIGFAHRPRRVLGELETRAVFGDGGQGQLGESVAGDDHAIRIARRGVAVLEVGENQPRSPSGRFGGVPVRGLALAPVYLGGKLVSIIEIAKTGHPFRKGDLDWMRAVTRAAAQRMAS
ncbi:MAG: hypothetical protein HOV80_11440 [Polyangiaceae bacterium]|nr:hypothetical protein [Polyangiaceae bacterium]